MIKIKLTQNKTTLVDKNIFEAVGNFKWYAKKNNKYWYAVRGLDKHNGKQVHAYLHHCVAGFPIKKMVVDHINGNTLDNRTKNLRIISYSENSVNVRKRRLGIKMGAFFDKSSKRKKRWRCRFTFQGKTYNLGIFKTKKEANNIYENKWKEIRRK